jgi:hypothetical protein
MPIVFVHGVANRRQNRDYAARWDRVEKMMRRYVAPEISASPDKVHISDGYWGDLGARFAWNGASKPASPILGMGAHSLAPPSEQAVLASQFSGALGDLPVAAPSVPAGLAPAGPAGGGAATGPHLDRLKNLSADELSDFIVTIVNELGTVQTASAFAAIAADEVARDRDTARKLAACASLEGEAKLIQQMVAARLAALSAESGEGLAGMGSSWISRLGDRIGEAAKRTGSAPVFAVSRVLVEVRKPLNDLVTLFLGDVFEYLAKRGTAQNPGPIPSRVIQVLSSARSFEPTGVEPLIVLSHSMGGQIIYDLVTHFLPGSSTHGNLRIDYWCAAASQVGLFEELKLFCASDERLTGKNNQMVQLPDRRFLGGWWNVWDPNDFISYTAQPIVQDVDDGAYNSGMSLVSAHDGYLERPSFFRRLADKVKTARTQNWRRL